jgi:hypothetical protein
VQTVKRTLDQRERMVAFARTAQGLEPAELQRRFIDEFGGEG